MMDYKSQRIDWDIYIERQQPVYLFASFIRPYGDYLKDVTGFGFQHQMYWYEKGTGVFYRSVREMEAADKHFLELARVNDKRLKEWSNEGLKWNQKADEMITKFSGEVSAEEVRRDFKDLQWQTEQVLLYSTVIPYRMLSGVNYAIDNEGAKESDFEEAMKLFEPLRADTRYPQIVETVYRSFWRVATALNESGDENIFSLTAPQELEKLFTRKENSKINDLARREDGCAFWLDDDDVKFSTEKDFLKNIGIQQIASDDVQEIKGSVANKGVVRGKVHIINKIEEVSDFNDGDIVVSINTSPSLMPVLQKCGGIITDEGGIMCHAAIVSRELDKPCIIGTKIATKVLRDGDEVELDANNGIAKIIK